MAGVARSDLAVYHFSGTAAGTVEIDFPGGPTTQFTLDPPLDPALIRIGADAISPGSSQFSLTLKDRHGMAWADYDRNGQTDLFIAVGGFGGRARDIAPQLRDELLVRRADGFHDIAADSGLVKDGCPGRQVAWVDFDNDGRSDLYAACGRILRDGVELQRNRLYRQLPDGRFAEVAQRHNLDLRGDGVFAWVDVNIDGAIDLIWAAHDGLWLLQNRRGDFIRTKLADIADIAKIEVGDFLNSGYPGIFAVSPTRNVLFENVRGRLAEIAPATLGLPDKSGAAAWLDFNNDGYDDFVALPQGFYRQLPGTKRFERAETDANFAGDSFYPAITGFDPNNSGRRTLLLARRQDSATPPREMHPAVAESKGSNRYNLELWSPVGKCSNHWLELDLDPRDSIVAIGARVVVETVRQTHAAHFGEAEGSLSSQGHHRLYFGLGNDTRAAMRIEWPDGSIDRYQDVAVDQLLLVARGRLCNSGAKTSCRSTRSAQ